MKVISHFCQGYSHIASGKPCQDCAYAESTPSLSMAIVSDGHGGDRYFRSDRGSQLLVEITKESIRSFVKNTTLPQSSFICFPNQQRSIDDFLHDKLMWLFGSIISQWNDRIEKDALECPLTEWEESHVEEKYKQEFCKGKSLEKIYGATLMTFVQTSDYWFAFHIGDGKLVTLRIKDENVFFSQPVPWDDKCFLNKTTSICDSEAINEFRYCYCSNNVFPDAVFLGSDGIDDTFGDGDKLYNFYLNLYNELATNGYESTYDDLKDTLPVLSKKGSKDDMSVACVYDENKLIHNAKILMQYKYNDLDTAFKTIKEKIDNLKDKKKVLICKAELSENERIDLEYIKKDLDKAEQERKRLIKVKGIVKTPIKHPIKSSKK